MTRLRVFSWIAIAALASTAFGQQPKKDQEARKNDAQADAPVVTFRDHATEVTSLAFRADGSQMVSMSAKDVRIWDPATGKEIRRLTVDDESVAAVNRDVSRLAIARSFHFHVPAALRGKLTLQDTASGKDVVSIDPHGDWDQNFPFRPTVAAMAFSPDGKRLATAGSLTKVGGRHGYPGGVVKIWDAETSKELQQFGALSTRADAVVFSADSKYLAAGTSGASGELPEPAEVHLWDATTGQRLHSFKTLPDVEQGGNPGSVASLAFHPRGTLLAAGVSDGTVRLWELPSGHELFEMRGHQGRTGGQEVDHFTGLISGPRSSVRSVAFSPDGTRLASAGYDRVVRVWDTQTGEQTRTYSFDSARINAVAFSPDGQRIAAAGSNAAKSGEAVIWPMSYQLEKSADPIRPTLRKSEIAKSDSEVRSQIESAVKTEDKNWQDLDEPRRGIRDRVVKVLARTPTLSDQQVTSAVYFLTVGRVPIDDEMKQARKKFAETKDRPLSVLQLTRGLVQGKDFNTAVAATNGRLFKIQKDFATKRDAGEIPIVMTADEAQKVFADSAAAVNQAAKTDEQFVDLAYLLAFSRFPSTPESNQLVGHLKKSPDRATAANDIFSFLINSREFLMSR